MKLILVVDDHDDTRELVAATLTEAGFAVVQAANGKAALDILLDAATPAPSLIVLDVDMPVMSGLDLLGIMRLYHRLSAIPVVVSSGIGRIEPIEHGAIVAFLPKPVDREVLLQTVKGVTGA